MFKRLVKFLLGRLSKDVKILNEEGPDLEQFIRDSLWNQAVLLVDVDDDKSKVFIFRAMPGMHGHKDGRKFYMFYLDNKSITVYLPKEP